MRGRVAGAWLTWWLLTAVCCGVANSTYIPVPNENMDESLQWDVTALRKAFNSCNDDEDVVVRVVCSRTYCMHSAFARLEPERATDHMHT